MGNQFKRPFPTPEEPSRGSSTPAIPEQDTVTAPAVNFPPTPNLPPGSLPPRGYVQGQYGQYGPRPGGQLFHGAGSAGPFGNAPVSQMGNPSFGGQQGGVPMNSLFGAMQAPPVTPMGGSGTAFGPQSMGGAGGMGGTGSAWGERSSLPGGFGERPGSVREREKSQAGKGQKGKKKRRVPIWARVVIVFLTILILLVGGGFTYYQIYFANTVNSITNKQVVRSRGETDPNKDKPSDVLNWGRINILLLGSDTDEKGVWTGNSYLAQTVIVASIDTATHEVDMLSIPRDFLINIPGHGMDKLDTAFAYGGSINNNMSGVATVYDTLDQDFGIKINFYGWVGLQGFIKVINTVDGVDVNVMHPIVDDTYPDDVAANGSGKKGFGYKRVYIGDGPQHLDGAMALEYVRSRHSTNDFDRSARQQQVLSALRLKMDNVGIVGQLPQIAADLNGSLYTSLNPTQLLELGNFARGIDANKIKHLTLSAPKYGRGASVQVHGQSEDVVLPNCNAIPAAVNAFLHITTAVCNIASNSSGQGPLLASSPGSSSGAQADTSSFADTSMMADAGQSLNAGLELSSWNDLFGIRDLLDLMSMVVLDSPQV
ncbi:MAG TPA: LCP family protein [Ktedonobacteraceae bacterium]